MSSGGSKFLGEIKLANRLGCGKRVVANLVGGHGHGLMLAVGIIEIIAGIGVALKPKTFAYVVDNQGTDRWDGAMRKVKDADEEEGGGKVIKLDRH